MREFNLANQSGIKEFVKSIDKKDLSKWNVVFKKKIKRSKTQNALYHLWLDAIGYHLLNCETDNKKWIHNQTHEALKLVYSQEVLGLCLTEFRIGLDFKILVTDFSTRFDSLSQAEANDYYNWVCNDFCPSYFDGKNANEVLKEYEQMI